VKRAVLDLIQRLIDNYPEHRLPLRLLALDVKEIGGGI